MRPERPRRPPERLEPPRRIDPDQRHPAEPPGLETRHELGKGALHRRGVLERDDPSTHPTLRSQCASSSSPSTRRSSESSVISTADAAAISCATVAAISPSLRTAARCCCSAVATAESAGTNASSATATRASATVFGLSVFFFRRPFFIPTPPAQAPAGTPPPP